MRICSNCGLSHDEGASRCRRCGSPLVKAEIAAPVKPPEPDALVRFCPRCGLSNPEKSVICRDCGASLKKIRPVSGQQAVERISRKIIRRMYWFDTLRVPYLIACGVTAAARAGFAHRLSLAFDASFPLAERLGRFGTDFRRRRFFGSVLVYRRGRRAELLLLPMGRDRCADPVGRRPDHPYSQLDIPLKTAPGKIPGLSACRKKSGSRRPFTSS